MSHPLVVQLQFARSEFRRCLEGVSADEGLRRLGVQNSIGWIIGHLANQEHAYWVFVAQGKGVAPDLHKLVGTGRPATTPPLDEMWATWQEVTAAADTYLEALTTDHLQTFFEWKGEPLKESVGTLLMRNIYHYWFHTGEAHGIRQQLGHADLPEFVGNMDAAIYRPE